MAAAAAADVPVVMVLLSGGSLDVSAELPLVHAALWAGYPGMRGGEAIADVLFGDFNPSAKVNLKNHKNPKDPKDPKDPNDPKDPKP